MYAIPISKEDGEAILKQYGKRVICEINGAKIHSAILKNETGFHILAGKATVQKIKASLSNKLIIHIKKDNTEFQATMPEELEAVLSTDEEAFHFFNDLTPGKKRSIIYTVSKAKQADTRIRRSLKIAERLKMGIKDLKQIIR